MNNLLVMTVDECNLMVINSMGLCFIFIVSLYFCHARHWSHKVATPLFFVYLFTVLTLLGEIVWKFIDGDPNLIWLNYVANMFSLGGCLFIGYFWLIYCFRSFPYKCFQTSWMKVIFAIPVIVEVMLVLLSPAIKLMYYIDESGLYVRGPLFFLQSMGYLYILVGSTVALSSINKVYTSVEKTHLRILAFTALPCLVISAIQFFLPAGGLPYFQFSMFLSLCGVFVHDEERQITVDSLTKLKTRYEFEKILNDKIKKAKQDSDKKLFVIAGDINAFKEINDSFGHSEGDVAICEVGDIMDQTASNYKAVAGRRSGDEFLIAVEGGNRWCAEEIVQNINAELDKFNAQKPYNITLSFGIAEYDTKENLMQLLDKADAAMYIEKKKLKKKLNR